MDEMMTNTDMFDTAVSHWIFRDVYGTHIVRVKNHSRLGYTILIWHLFHPKELGVATSCGNVLYLYSRSHTIFFSCWTTWLSCFQEKNNPISILPVIRAPCLVCITISYKNKIFIKSIPETIVDYTCYKLQSMLGTMEMRHSWIFWYWAHTPTTKTMSGRLAIK